MANATQFLGNRTMGNAKVAAKIKSGSRCKILECEVKEAPVSKEEVLAIKVKECDGWIRINITNLTGLIQTFGKDSDSWIGKTVEITSFQGEVMGKMQTQLNIKPVKG